MEIYHLRGTFNVLILLSFSLGSKITVTNRLRAIRKAPTANRSPLPICSSCSCSPFHAFPFWRDCVVITER